MCYAMLLLYVYTPLLLSRSTPENTGCDNVPLDATVMYTVTATLNSCEGLNHGDTVRCVCMYVRRGSLVEGGGTVWGDSLVCMYVRKSTLVDGDNQVCMYVRKSTLVEGRGTVSGVYVRKEKYIS